MTTEKPSFGALLKEYRERKDWTLREFAKHVPFSYSHLGRFETGERNPPDRDGVIKLAAALGVNPNSLLLAAGYASIEHPEPQEPDQTLLGLVNEFGQVEYPPTLQEQAIYNESMRLGFPGWPTLTEPGFWSRPPEDRLRRSTFRNIEAAVDDAKAFYGENGG